MLDMRRIPDLGATKESEDREGHLYYMDLYISIPEKKTIYKKFY